VKVKFRKERDRKEQKEEVKKEENEMK